MEREGGKRPLRLSNCGLALKAAKRSSVGNILLERWLLNATGSLQHLMHSHLGLPVRQYVPAEAIIAGMASQRVHPKPRIGASPCRLHAQGGGVITQSILLQLIQPAAIIDRVTCWSTWYYTWAQAMSQPRMISPRC